MPSSAIQPADPALHLRVLHEDLTFHCRDRLCGVTATYTIDADAAAETELAFVLPVDRPVVATIGHITVGATVSRLDALPSDFAAHLDLRHEYVTPDASPLPPLYQAAVHATFVPGRNRVSFSYEQPLGAHEGAYSYFSSGPMIPRLIYVLWPLREWKREPGFTIALRIEMDREPPGWWKRTFGHPLDVSCDGFNGQTAQVGARLVYTTTLPDTFPDYLSCPVGEP